MLIGEFKLGFNLGTSNLEYMRWALEENVVGIVDIFEGALWSGAPMETLDELLAYDESHDKLIVISDLNYISYVHFSPENKKNLPILRYLFQKGFDVNKVRSCLRLVVSLIPRDTPMAVHFWMWQWRNLISTL